MDAATGAVHPARAEGGKVTPRQDAQLTYSGSPESLETLKANPWMAESIVRGMAKSRKDGHPLTATALELVLQELVDLRSAAGRERVWVRINGPDDLPEEDGWYLFEYDDEFKAVDWFDGMRPERSHYVRHCSHWKRIDGPGGSTT